MLLEVGMEIAFN